MTGIFEDFEKFNEAVANLDQKWNAASAKAVFLVSPDYFRLESECAGDNEYMDLGLEVDVQKALYQHSQLVQAIKSVGLPAIVFPGIKESADAVFPNNVYATTADRIIVGRMFHAVRQEEAKRKDIKGLFTQIVGKELYDLSQRDLVTELTGPYIIDRARGIGFCGMSKRINKSGLAAMHDAFEMNCSLEFPLVETEYHTNVVMSVLAGRACVIHMGSIAKPGLDKVLEKIYPQKVMYLNDEEKEAFAGNCIALTNKDVFMSQTGVDALSEKNSHLLQEWGFELHGIDVSEIEKAGGSLRCMVAEIY